MAVTTTTPKGEVTVTHEGRVLSHHVRETRVMSDVYCDCLYVTVIKDSGETETFMAKAYFELSPNRVSVEDDATDEARARVKVYRDLYSVKNALAAARADLAAAEKAIAKPKGSYSVKRGDKVVSVRKVKGCPKGTEGEVFWVGTCKFSGKPRVGFKDDAGSTYWVNACSVEVPGAAAAANAKVVSDAKVAKAAAERHIAVATADLAVAEADYETVVGFKAAA
jgi:hypothetical protein